MLKKDKKWLTDKEYKFIYGRSPRVCVDLIILRGKNKFLLTKRGMPPFKGLWHFVGGRVRFHETVNAAAKRIARDEIGAKISSLIFLGFYEIFNEEGPHFHDVSQIFAVKIKPGKLHGSRQSAEAKFFDKIPSKMIPAQKKFLQANLRRKIWKR